ncbi:MAG: hypothetical protein GX130_07600 [Candidatus Hydrogenedens sp.]|jgi:hypothetical protein|nr:hypothetical protein [Candidatus Hydrogenedens sp.]
MIDQLKSRLNLKAVLRNLEVLPALDPVSAELISDWNISLRFSVWRDTQVVLDFHDGRCVFHSDSKESTSVNLFFSSPAHLNNMFENQASPLPLKGFTKLGFLKKEFSQLIGRLEYFLKPAAETVQDEAFKKVNLALSLNTAVFAIPELMKLDPVSRRIAPQFSAGSLQFSVDPDGPHAHIIFDGQSRAVAFPGPAVNPTAMTVFKNSEVAQALVAGTLDSFAAVATADIQLRGMIPLIDHSNVILDRLPLYLQ